MPNTTWKLTLSDAGSRPAKRITAALTPMLAALRAVAGASASAQAALDKVGGGTTAGRLRAQTSLIRAQTQAIKEQRAASVVQARADRSAAAQRAREMKHQIDAHKAVARSQAQAATAARRAQSQAAGGRTRLDIGAAPMGGRTRMDIGAALAGRTRMDVGAPAGAAGRTRVDVDALGGRTRAEGPTAGEFQARARALQIAHSAKSAAIAERAANRNAAIVARAHKREENETARHYRNIHSAAQRNARAIERVNAQSSARRARQQMATRRADVRNSQAQSTATLGALGAVGGIAAGAVAALAGIAAAFVGVGYSAASAVIEVAAFRESSLVALEAVLGSSAAAGRQFRNAVQVANQTPLDTRDVIAQTQSFAVAGFGERDIAPLIAASADLGAAFGQRSSEGFALALSQIRSAGRLQGQELLQLSNANVSRSAILDSIARQMNLGQGEVGRRAAQTAITQRRVTSGVGEQAALDAVRGRLDGGGALGTFARQQSETLTGAISNARNAIFNLLIGIDFGNVPGIVAFKNILLQVTAALQTGSPAATRLRAGITGAANAVGGLLARAINPTTISAGMTALSTGFATVQRFATTAWPIVQAFMRGVGPGFMAGIAPLRAMFASLAAGGGPSAQTLALMARAALGLGQAFGFVAGATVTLFGAVNTFFVILGGIGATITGLVAGIAMQVRQAFMSVGTNIIAGIRTGVLGALPSLGTMMSGVGTSLVGAVTSTLGIQSPSRVFADVVGRQIPAGIAMGVNAGAPVAQDAVSGIVSPRVPELGGRGGASVSIEINVTGGGQPQETARAIRAEMEDALGSIFGQWAEATP